MSTEQPAPTATQPAARTEHTEHAADHQHTWGAPQPPKQPTQWTTRKTVVAVTIAVGIAAVGGAIVYAGTSGDSQQQGPGGMGPGMGRGMTGQFPGAAGADVLDALHGDFTVSDGNSGYETQRMQTGEVTKVSDTSISVSSDDGYTQTYRIDSSTEQQSESAKGDTVRIVATVSGDSATADSIISGDSATGMPGQQGGIPGQQGPGQQGGMRGQAPGQQGGMPGQGQQPPGQSGPN